MLEQQQIEAITGQVQEMGLVEGLTSALRGNYPGYSFTLCSDDDIATNARPVFESSAFNLYLVGSSDSCLSLTNSLELASGVVIAEREDEDE